MKKRILGLVLSVAMVVSCMPGMAFAEKAVKSEIVEETYAVEGEVSEIVTFSNIEEVAPLCGYKVYLPEGYSEEASYPTLFLMPYDGYSAAQYIEDGIQARLDELMATDSVVDMVVVMPEFVEGDDYRAMLPALIEDVEEKYSVISESAYRAILGVNVGGYMAYETAFISKSTAFIAFGSHMGDFTSEANHTLQKDLLWIQLISSADYHAAQITSILMDQTKMLLQLCQMEHLILVEH